MKKLVLSLMAVAFAVAAQAGTEKSTTTTAPSCCAAMTSQTKVECSMGKEAKSCCSMDKTTKTACTKPILKSPKALG